MRSGWGIRSRMSDERGTLVMLSAGARSSFSSWGTFSLRSESTSFARAMALRLDSHCARNT